MKIGIAYRVRNLDEPPVIAPTNLMGPGPWVHVWRNGFKHTSLVRKERLTACYVVSYPNDYEEPWIRKRKKVSSP